MSVESIIKENELLNDTWIDRPEVSLALKEFKPTKYILNYSI